MARILFQFRPYLIIVDSTDAIAKREKERERERGKEKRERVGSAAYANGVRSCDAFPRPLPFGRATSRETCPRI